MGGKLFNLPRMPRDAYLEVEAAVRAYLDSRMPGQYRIPRYYGDKPDFGDMDVIVALRPDWEAVRAGMVRDLRIHDSRGDGNVFSMAYRGLQTDFFTVPARYLDSAFTFMCYNDLGNFIGRICRRFDLKYGDRGLAYVYRRADGNYRADLELTLDFARVCAFLGLDYAAWCDGFGSLPEMFAWVVASPWFSVAPYLDEVTGNLHRQAARRTTVSRFVAWLRAEGVDNRPVFADRAGYLPMVAAAFPEADLPAQIARERDAEARQRALAAKFSGKQVMRLIPGLEGKPLGELIVGFKASKPDFERWVLAAPQEEIDAAIRAFASRR